MDRCTMLATKNSGKYFSDLILGDRKTAAVPAKVLAGKPCLLQVRVLLFHILIERITPPHAEKVRASEDIMPVDWLLKIQVESAEGLSVFLAIL